MGMARRVIRHSYILLNVDYVKLGSLWNYRQVLSPYYRLYYINEGKGTVCDQNGTWVLEPGFMYLIPSFTLCDLRCEAHLGQYAQFVGSKPLPSSRSNSIPSKVVDLLSFIQMNLHQPLTVQQLAGMVNLHPDYLSRLFLKLTGERSLSYIHIKRIERAQYLMVTTDQSLVQISEATGFDTLPHFTKVFKKVTSLTPGRYRDQHQGTGIF